ncbi:BppU family phage baseplate upper protein [Bacillus sp. BSL6]
MTFKTRELTVDLVNEMSTKEIRFSQGDRNSAKLVLNITNEGQELDLSQAKAVRITFNKPDGTIVFQEDLQPINAMKGKYQIILKTQTLAAAGNVYGQVRIFEEGDRELDAEPFVFTVKQSYSGDTAVESTNEFTIIQRALEVGEKFQNVDFDPIIKAGELAQGSLPKTGGTMTGVLNVNNDIYIKSKDGIKQFAFAVDANGKLWFSDKTNSRDIFTVEADGTFRVAGLSNLLKKSGDDVLGDLKFANGRMLRFQRPDNLSGIAIGADSKGGIYAWSDFAAKGVFTYSPETHLFNMQADTNLLKKTGDMMTGTLKMSPMAIITQEQLKTTANAKGIFYTDAGSTTTVAGIGRYVDETGADFLYMGHGGSPWGGGATGGLRVSPTQFSYKGKNIMTAEKDDRAIIPVTADAELITSYGVIADRRGNTVTLRAPIRRRVGSTNGHVLTLPPGMRPTMMLTQVVHASDGTPALITIPSDTGQVLLQTITPAIMGKDYHIVLTYVVD